MTGTRAGRRSDALDATTRAILEHWQKTDPNDRLAHLVRDVARGLTRSLQFRLSEHGISFGHWAFLRVLWAHDGLSQRELSVHTGLTESTTHTALNRMERLGLVTRRHREGNQRRLHVFLTREGRELESVLVPLAEEVNEIAVRGLDDAEITILRRGLLNAVTNLAEDELKAVRLGRRIQSTRDLGKRHARAMESMSGDDGSGSGGGEN